jgi:hypothetical protein
MVDAYPEVYSGADAPLVRRLLRAQGMDAGDEEEVLSHLQRKGSCFVPRLNAILIGEFSLVHAGEEAGHFVNMALKRQLYERAPRQAQRHDYFYASTMEEALAFFASKIIHPARNHFQESLYFRLYGKDPATIERESGQTHAEVQEITRFILLHKRLEQRYGDYERVPGEILRGIGADARRLRVLTHELGYYLGQQLYDGYQAGVISREEIAALFQARFDESGSALKAYLSLAEKLAGQVAGTPEPQA